MQPTSTRNEISLMFPERLVCFREWYYQISINLSLGKLVIIVIVIITVLCTVMFNVLLRNNTCFRQQVNKLERRFVIKKIT